MKDNIDDRKANDDEEERKCVLGFRCECYGDTVKKRELIRLYMDKQFHHSRIQNS